MKKRITALIAIAAMCLSLCACTDKQTAKNSDIDLSSYPIKTDVTLNYWMPLSANVSASVPNFGETEYAKEIEKHTGVKVNYIHPAYGQDNEAFNLLAASGDLPDIVRHSWISQVAGGPQGALNNQLIIPLNDMMEEYAPNLSAFLAKNKNVDRDVKTDDGIYYAFPLVRNSAKLQASFGPVVRADWLSELGIKAPETFEEWEEMLIAFRDKKGAKAPLSFVGNLAARRWLFKTAGATLDFFVEDDKVKFGVLEEDFKTAVARLNKWYKDGLLDPNYALVDTKILDANMLNGQSGATFASGGSGIGKWLTAKAGEDFDLLALELPKTDGKPNKYQSFGSGYTGESSAAISSNCKTPELAAKYLDYFYGEEGHMLANFGVEGVTYEMVDGYPTYTDLIMKNPDGKSVSQAMAYYIGASASGAIIQDERYIEQFYELPQQKHASEVWSVESKEIKGLPPVTYSTAESSEYATIYNDIQKFCNENIAAFIAGTKSLDEYDSFIADIEKMGIKRVLEIQQAAYDRYLKR